MPDSPVFAFRAMTEDDLPRMLRWLLEPHVAQFYVYNSRKPLTLEKVRDIYLGRIRGDDPWFSYIALCDAAPIGYLQTYRISDHAEYAQQIDIGADAAGVDMLIGEPGYAHRGLGAPLLRAFIADVVWAVTGARTCWIGPSVDNTRAIRAYEKAGFVHVKTVAIDGEDQPEYLMRYQPSSEQ